MQQIRYTSQASDLVGALKSARAAKNIFLVILLVMILAQIASFVAVHFAGVLDPIYEHELNAGRDVKAAIAAETEKQDDSKEPAKEDADARGAEGGEDPNAAPAETEGAQPESVDEGSLGRSEFIRYVMRWGLPGSRFFALVSAILLCLTLLMAVNISLVDRLGGSAPLASSFFWSLVLLAMVTPWQQLLRGSFACGALFNYGEMIEWVKDVRSSWGGSEPETMELVLFYARFLGYPVLALLLWLAVQLKFMSGFKSIRAGQPAGGGSTASSSGSDEVETPELPLEDLPQQ